MISYGKLKTNGEDESWIARAIAWGPDIPNWSDVFEAARAQAYGRYKDDSDKEENMEASKEEVPTPSPDTAPSPKAASPTGVWDEGAAAHDDTDFGVDDEEEDDMDVVDEAENARRRAAAEEEARYEAEEYTSHQREVFLRESEREKNLTERYKVKKEESEGERRSRPRRSSVAEEVEEETGGGGETFATPCGAESPAEVDPETARDKAHADEDRVDEIITILLDDLRGLPERGRNP